MTTWITDDNGNRASVEYWGSEEAADEIERLQTELDAMKGMWGQYSPNHGPFIEHAQKEWAENRKWVFDSSHDVSMLLSDGTRRKVGTFQHASDAEEAELAVNGVRSGRLVDSATLAEREAKVRADTLREALVATKRMQEVISELLVLVDELMAPTEGEFSMHVGGQTPDWFVEAARLSCYHPIETLIKENSDARN